MLDRFFWICAIGTVQGGQPSSISPSQSLSKPSQLVSTASYPGPEHRHSFATHDGATSEQTPLHSPTGGWLASETHATQAPLDGSQYGLSEPLAQSASLWQVQLG
jgi:hypothetical protein